MKCNKKNIASWLFVTIFSFYSLQVKAQGGKSGIVTDKAQLVKLRAAVIAQIDSPKVHQAYITAMGIDNPELEKQYENWMKQYPKSAVIPYSIAKGYLDHENPKAKPYLLKTVAIDPKFTEAWGGLWIDGERWGDFEVSRDYLKKATESDPFNPNYAFYYASSLDNVDELKWEQLSLDVAKRFPNHERGAQALYWLAARSKKPEDKQKYFELLLKSYAPEKFNWSAGGAYNYYYFLLPQNPKKALELAQNLAQNEKGERKEWPDMVALAQGVTNAKMLLDNKKGAEAKQALSLVKLPRRSPFATELIVMKAQAADISGQTQTAYDSLLVAFTKFPEVRLKTVISGYGRKLGKDLTEIDKDIWNQLDANAKPATPFNSLKRYLTQGEASLSDFRGKAVLLTYWFPGCGPCRGEFPHFENVVRKFKGKDLEYVGINIVSEQNEYVVPFMKSSGYSFTPLEDVKDRQKGNLDNRNAAPMNFLLDKKGRIIFSDFRTNGDNEDDLEMMISMLVK